MSDHRPATLDVYYVRGVQISSGFPKGPGVLTSSLKGLLWPRATDGLDQNVKGQPDPLILWPVGIQGIRRTVLSTKAC